MSHDRSASVADDLNVARGGDGHGGSADAPPADRSTARLVSDLPRITVELVQAELASFVAEIKARLVKAGIGAGLLVAGALVAFFALATLIAAAVLGLALVMNGWLAALIVFVVLLVIAGIAALVGLRSVKRGLKGTDTDDGSGSGSDDTHR